MISRLAPRELEVFSVYYLMWRFEGAPATLTDVEQRCNMHRPVAQDTVDRIARKGCLEKHGKRRAVTIPPAIRNYLEEKKDDLPRLLSPYYKPRRMPNLQTERRPA